MTRCGVPELLVGQCAHCRCPTAPTPPDPFTVARTALGRWFAAGYPGECSGCGDIFDAGDRIRADGEDGYLAECCGGDE